MSAESYAEARYAEACRDEAFRHRIVDLGEDPEDIEVVADATPIGEVAGRIWPRAAAGVPIRELVAVVADDGVDLVWVECVRSRP